jgi:hypothetical protein
VMGVPRSSRAEAGFLFKGRHFDASLILLCVRWYLSYGLVIAHGAGKRGCAETRNMS